MRTYFRDKQVHISADIAYAFWRYYTDDSIHDFFKPGSAEEANAFAAPPWLVD